MKDEKPDLTIFFDRGLYGEFTAEESPKAVAICLFSRQIDELYPRTESLGGKLQAIQQRIADAGAEYDRLLKSGQRQKANSAIDRIPDLQKDREGVLAELLAAEKQIGEIDTALHDFAAKNNTAFFQRREEIKREAERADRRLNELIERPRRDSRRLRELQASIEKIRRRHGVE